MLLAWVPGSARGNAIDPANGRQYAFWTNDLGFFNGGTVYVADGDTVEVKWYLVLDQGAKTAIQDSGIGYAALTIAADTPLGGWSSNASPAYISELIEPAGYSGHTFNGWQRGTYGEGANLYIQNDGGGEGSVAIKTSDNISAVLLGTLEFTGNGAVSDSIKFWTQYNDADSAGMVAGDSTWIAPTWPDPPLDGRDISEIPLTIEVVAAVPLPSVAWSALLGLGVLGISRIVGRSRLHA
ncbi:MAG: hypothetical protein NTU53_13770 [Planctomycetota bacterium]|nr:hypothetical protein [Planctomycetota bacterium]